MRVVVSDTSPIRALDHLGLCSLLSAFYEEVLIPPGVAEELSDPSSALPPLHWKSIRGVRVQAPTDAARVAELLVALDQGESEAIALAVEIGADALLVDERAARRVAASFGIRTVGVLAMLVRAKEEGQVKAVGPLMESLRTGIGFHISGSLYAEVLRLAKE